MTKELDKLLLSIGKEVEITSQQFSLLALDKHLKSLSESSLICKVSYFLWSCIYFIVLSTIVLTDYGL